MKYGDLGNESSSRLFTKLGAELLYRFGMDEDFYVGGRYVVTTQYQVKALMMATSISQESTSVVAGS
ncbi:MAG: hypothetical protein U5K35_07370 [Rhodohalobacter sp.]|nr:hypothetical protein [Rhodohalobacter sp.]